MSYYEHECEPEPSEYDEAVEGFKELLRKEVSEETQNRLKHLEKSNKDLREKVANLSKLEREAESRIREAMYAKGQAERTAKMEANRLRACELLDLIATPKYTVKATSVMIPKCDKCNEKRQLVYTTPRGNEAFEYCECNKSTRKYVTEMQRVATGGRHRNDKLQVWYQADASFNKEKEEHDYFRSEVLRTPAGIEEMIKHGYSSFGFDTEEEAQKLADALNELEKDKEPSNGIW